jgi:hypothetical protein
LLCTRSVVTPGILRASPSVLHGTAHPRPPRPGAPRWRAVASRVTRNTAFACAAGLDFRGTQLEQEAIASFQAHVSYTFRPRLWVAADATYYKGGRTRIDGRVAANLQENSRVGLTVSVPVTQRQSLKLSWSDGAATRFSADFTTYGLMCSTHGSIDSARSEIQVNIHTILNCFAVCWLAASNAVRPPTTRCAIACRITLRACSANTLHDGIAEPLCCPSSTAEIPGEQSSANLAAIRTPLWERRLLRSAQAW